MLPAILALQIGEGTVLVGPSRSLDAITGKWSIDDNVYGSRIGDILSRHADSWRLREAVVGWGIESFDPRQRTEQRLHRQIARMVETGRLSARFLPLFRDDPGGPREVGRLRIYQLGEGPFT